MTAKKSRKSSSKRKRIPVTAAQPVSRASDGSTKGLPGLPSTPDVDALSVLMAITPSGKETTSATSSLLTIKGSGSASRKKTSLATAQLIRRYHTLNKELSKCLARIDNKKSTHADGYHSKPQSLENIAADLARIAEIRQEMDDLGGLDMYQKASTLGQSKQRGGDSSKWLVPILERCHPQLNKKAGPPLRLLDIGALSPHNYIKYSSWIRTTPIDLNPQDPLIIKMDFLEMPVPTGQEQQFDIVCLSLVVNFVGDPVQRGEILCHSARFLVPGSGILYLVLPLPCIQNSRYMDHELLVEMMASLGYSTLISHHFAKKLAYYAFKLDVDLNGAAKSSKDKESRRVRPLFPKKLRHDKPNRNK
ncbi:hypothetical protein BG011_003370 [Mortierella polycephala]|uniref:25S rRNA adenine-N(1) methyltransferase n=1 Tax=Mortierella polycephala TaxID=41804 RepID=A0A9P6U304_9FUNG|nr:hypothetical protein BG011_003370 [Mortierella polycephala]